VFNRQSLIAIFFTRQLIIVLSLQITAQDQDASDPIDLPQVDHGGGRARGRERATRATKSRVVDLSPLQEFKSH
jgi:hypothetical protein